MRNRLITWFFAAALVPTAALGEPCTRTLASVAGQTAYVNIATLDEYGAMTYVTATLRYTRPLISGGTRLRAGRWATAPSEPAWQYFSDRVANGGQLFAVGRPDRVAVTILEEDPPVVQMIFVSRRNASLGFTGRCSANGIIHGSYRNMDVLVSMGPPPG